MLLATAIGSDPPIVSYHPIESHDGADMHISDVSTAINIVSAEINNIQGILLITERSMFSYLLTIKLISYAVSK